MTHAPLPCIRLVSFQPLFYLSLCQTQDVLSGVGRSFTAAHMQEVQTGFGLIQVFLIACGVTQLTASILLQQSSGFGVVLLLADDLLHGTSLLSCWQSCSNYTQKNWKSKSFYEVS